jgi:hypothetical protein
MYPGSSLDIELVVVDLGVTIAGCYCLFNEIFRFNVLVE